MRPGGGKAKGSGFEREICRGLSESMTAGERDDLFWRSAMSGGRASVRFKKGGKNVTQAGDISAIDPIGDRLTKLFLIECKFYRDLILVGLFHGIKGGINKHWLQCTTQARQHNKLPLLIARQNGIKPLVVLTQDGVNVFSIEQKLSIATFYSGEGLHVLWYSEFLKHARVP